MNIDLFRLNIPKFESKVNFKHKNASPGKSLYAETIFFYYHHEIDQETHFEGKFQVEILINKGVIKLIRCRCDFLAKAAVTCM